MAKDNTAKKAGIPAVADVFKNLDSFSSVGASQTANITIPVGPTYDEIHVEYSGVTLAQMTGVRVGLNADDIVDVTATELVMMEGHKANAASAGNFTIPFREIMARTFFGANLTGLVTLSTDTITLEIDIAAGAAAPVLNAWAVTSPARRSRAVYPRLKRYSTTPGATGDFEFHTLPRGNRIKRIFIGGGVGVIDSLEIERTVNGNSSKIWKASKLRNDYQLGRHGLVPQTGYYSFDSTYEGFISEKMLVTASQSFVLRMNVTTAGTLPILVESLERQS